MKIKRQTLKHSQNTGENPLKRVYVTLTLIYLSSFLFTNFVIYLFAVYLNSTVVKAIILVRDFSIFILLFLFLPRRISKFVPNLILAVLFFLGSVFLGFVMHPSFSSSALIYLRLYVFPWLFLLAGYFLGTSFDIKPQKWLLSIRIILVVYAFLSLIVYVFRRFLLSCYNFEAFADITLKSYYDSYYCLLKNAVSYDFYKLITSGVTRLFGLVLDPPISGIILSFGAFFLFLKRRFAFLEIIIIVASVLTLSKGAFFIIVLFVFLALINMGLSQLRFYRTRQVFNVLVMLGLLGLLFVFMFMGNIGLTKSITNHMQGLSRGIQIMFSSPLGTGLGTQGNFSPESSVRESFVGALGAQVGILGFVSYIFLMYVVAKSYITQLKRKNYVYWGLSLFFFIYLLSAFFSESSISLSGGAIIFFTYGVIYATMIKRSFESRKANKSKMLLKKSHV